MAELDQLLEAQLSGGLADLAPGAPQLELDFGELLRPGITLAERRELAELMAGTSDRKGRAYQSSMRDLQRWTTSKGKQKRKPSARSRERLKSAARQQNERIRLFRAHGGDMQVLVVWLSGLSSQDAPEWKPPHDWVHIRQQVMRYVIRLWAAGEPEEAADELMREFLTMYRVAEPNDWLQWVEVIDLRLEPSKPKGA